MARGQYSTQNIYGHLEAWCTKKIVAAEGEEATQQCKWMTVAQIVIYFYFIKIRHDSLFQKLHGQKQRRYEYKVASEHRLLIIIQISSFANSIASASSIFHGILVY